MDILSQKTICLRKYENYYWVYSHFSWIHPNNENFLDNSRGIACLFLIFLIIVIFLFTISHS